MIRAFFILATLSVLFSACTQRMVCPAFQSAFIYDKDALRKKFSYFQEDSTPKILTASKNRYLIAESVPYRKKLASLATVEMKPVFPVVPDSLTIGQDDVSLADLDKAARSVIDSTFIVDVPQAPDTLEVADPDSTYVITRDKEVRMLRYNPDSVTYRIDDIRFNIDQDNYMWYLRDVLVLPDVRLAQMQSKWDEEDAKREEKQKKGGFFRNLFKKKDKKRDKELPADTLLVEPPQERSEFDFEYNENEPVQDTVTEVEPARKKGVFSFLKKEKKAKNEKIDRTKEAKTSDGPASDQPRERKERKQKVPKDEDPTDLKPADEEVQGDEGF
ncbi:MAG: hypothetical protein DIU61_007050 [Bacteroidota bacterium]|jgi:hypothetical protein|nr:MAG: hypothetical protein DIU61_00330 [Bacteroidota bacterium]